MTSITRLGSDAALPTPDPSNSGGLPAFFVGGRETLLYLSSEAGSEAWQPRKITRFEVTMTPAGGQPQALDVRPNADPADPAAVAVRVPDVRLRGTVDIAVEWRDACFALAAEVSAPLIIDQPASLSGCATERDGAFDELEAVFAPPMSAGSISAKLVPWRFLGKVTPLAVIDPLPPYVGFTRTTPILSLAPGATIAISHTNDALDLRKWGTVKATYYRRGPLIRWLEGGWIHGDEPEANVVARSPITAQADGSFTIKAPTDPARYAVEVLFDYNSACSFGVAGFTLGVDVVAP